MNQSAAFSDWVEALPDGKTITPFGTIRKQDEGHVVISASPDQAKAWATRPGEAWPCSTLRRLDGFGVTVDVYPRGEIVWDLHRLASRDKDAWVDDHEAWCWMEDCIASALEAK